MKLTRTRIIPPLLLIYTFLAPLGNLARFGREEGAYGVTTILLLGIILIGAPTAGAGIRRHPVLESIGLLTAWMMGASFFSIEPVNAFLSTGTLLIYLLAAAVSYHYIADEQLMMRLLTIYCLGALLSAGATLIDFAGIIDIPGVNERILSTRTELGGINQVSGSFARRSAMAAYYTMSITIGFLTPVLIPKISNLKKMFFWTASGSCLIVLLMTHNRGGVVGAMIACLIMVLLTTKSPTRFIKMGSFLFIAAALLIYVIGNWFPDVWIAYQALLGIGDVDILNARQLQESDFLRIVLFKHALESLLFNPIGHGYSLITGVAGNASRQVDPHNILSQIIWGAGIFGVTWIFYFFNKMMHLSRFLIRKSNRQFMSTSIGLVSMGGLIAFMLTGMTHTIISTGIAWIFLGVYLRILQNRKHDTYEGAIVSNAYHFSK